MWNRNDYVGEDSIMDFIERGFRPIYEGDVEHSSHSFPDAEESGMQVESRETLRVTNRELGCHREATCQAHLVFPSREARTQFLSMPERLCPKCKKKLDSQDLGFSDYGKGNLESGRKMSDQRREQKFFYTQRAGVGYMVAEPGYFKSFEKNGYEYDKETGFWDERRVFVTYEG